MNESKLLKNHNKCPMITTNLNQKMENSHSFVTCPNPTFKNHQASLKDSILNLPYYHKCALKSAEKSPFLLQILHILICTFKTRIITVVLQVIRLFTLMSISMTMYLITQIKILSIKLIFLYQHVTDTENKYTEEQDRTQRYRELDTMRTGTIAAPSIDIVKLPHFLGSLLN